MRQAPLIYAGRLERLLAFLLDLILAYVISVIVGTILQPFGFAVPGMFLATAAYYTLSTASSWQATPAKYMLSLYVIRTDGRPLTKRDALERFLAFFMPNLPAYASFLPAEALPTIAMVMYLFWFMPVLTTPERVGFHDRLCNTRVVVGRVNR